MVRVRWIGSTAELKALGERYDRFVLAASPLGMFYRSAWIECVWPYYEAQEGGKLAFLVAEKGDEIVGLAPLQIKTRRWVYANQRVFTFLGGTGDELDNWVPQFLFADTRPEEQAACARALVESILAHSNEWDELNFGTFPEDCPSRSALRAALPVNQESNCLNQIPIARLDDGPEPYFRSRGKRLTRMLVRAERRLDEDGVSAIFAVETQLSAERKGAVEAIHLARQNQLRAGGEPRTSPFDDSASAAVFWRLMAIAETCGHLRAHWLLLDGVPAAFVLAMCHADAAVLFLNAFSPEAEKYHPGVLLLSRLIDHEAKLQRTKLIDFMAGSNLAKELYATHMRSLGSFRAENPINRLARVRSGVARNVGMLRAMLS